MESSRGRKESWEREELHAGGRGERRQKTLRVLHLDQGMTDNIPADHLSAPLFDDKAHPPSAIHYQLSLPEARASIMLPLGDAVPPPCCTAGPAIAGGHSQPHIITTLQCSPHLPGS